MSGYTMDQLAQAFIKLRDLRSEAKKVFDDRDTVMKEQGDRIKGLMLEYLRTNKLEQVRTEQGTVYTIKSRDYACADWNVLREWSKETGRVDVFESRLMKSVIKELEQDGNMPPGVTGSDEINVGVRRK